MITVENSRFGLKARGYVLSHRKLKYDDIVAYADSKYSTPEEAKLFVLAVLDADMIISTERARAKKQRQIMPSNILGS